MKNENLPFESQKFELAWNEWLQFRKERRLPAYKPTGLRKTFAMLERISNKDAETAIQIIDQSIEQNWQGLHPLKNNNARSNNTPANGQGSISKQKADAASNFIEKARAEHAAYFGKTGD